MSKFTELLKINVNDHTEKKGRFTYLSWPFAVSELRKADPKATWEVIKYDGKPYCASECGYFVEVAVTVDGVTLSQIHPVLDNSNKAIAKPNAFQINTSIQRCLVKAIALHGLGLYIYSGEDIPEEEQKKTELRPLITEAQALAKVNEAANATALNKAAREMKKDCERDLSLDEYARVKQAIEDKLTEFRQAVAV